jgi:hypothetical protein
MGVPTVFPDGVTNAALNSLPALYGALYPAKYYQFFTDFDRYNAATSGVCDWLATITEAGAGSASAVVQDALGGVLLVTNDAADNDAYFAQWAGQNSANVAETFKFVAGKQTWFEARFKVSDATQSDLILGLVIADTSPLDATDKLAFTKADGSTTLNLEITKNSTTTTVTAATLANDTWVTVGYYYDGVDSVDCYVNGNRVGSGVVTNLPDDEELAVTFGIQNGEAVAKTLSLDWIFAATER